MPRAQDHTANIPTIPSSMAPGAQGQAYDFEEFRTYFESILSVLQICMIDDSGSPKNKPSSCKLIDTSASEFVDRLA